MIDFDTSGAPRTVDDVGVLNRSKLVSRRPKLKVRTTILFACLFTLGVLLSRPAISSATITLVNVATDTISLGKSLTISVPSGTGAGDLMVAQLAISSGSSKIPTPPWGWTSFNSLHRAAAPALSQWIWYRVAGPSEPDSYTWTAQQTCRWAGGIATYRGVNTSATLPFDGSSIASGARGTSLTAPSLMTAYAGDQLIVFFSGTGNNFSSPPAAMTQQWRLDSGSTPSDVDAWLSDRSLPRSGATGTQTATQLLNKPWQAILIALLPNTHAPYFSTAPYGAGLPSDSTCENQIASTPETILTNTAMNALTPTSSELSAYLNSPLSWGTSTATRLIPLSWRESMVHSPALTSRPT